MQRSGKEDSTRQRWRQTEGERERERQRDRETERGRGKREGERCKWWAAGVSQSVSDFFLSLGYLSFGEKTGKNGKRKKRREKETETKQAPKTYSNCSHCGPERPATVRKSKHPKRTRIVDITVRKTCSGPEKQAPKRTLIVAIAVRKGMERSGKASTQNAL